MGNAFKRELKAFIRLDGSGRKIAGSLIYRKNKPKVGEWVQVTAYQCCDMWETTTSTSSTSTTSTSTSSTTTTSTTTPG